MKTPLPFPASHADLIDGRFDAVLSTLMPDGQPQTTPVWFIHQGDHIDLNIMREHQKYRNMRRNPRVTLLIFDPQHPLRNVEIRGRVVEMTEVDALAHLNHLTRHYLRSPDARFFGDCIPAELAARYHPVIVRILPTRIRTEG